MITNQLVIPCVLSDCSRILPQSVPSQSKCLQTCAQTSVWLLENHPFAVLGQGIKRGKPQSWSAPSLLLSPLNHLCQSWTSVSHCRWFLPSGRASSRQTRSGTPAKGHVRFTEPAVHMIKSQRCCTNAASFEQCYQEGDPIQFLSYK